MLYSNFDSEGMSVPVVTVSALVIGTGAAGYNAALRLHELGVTDTAILTEGVNTGTSRNTGSDKQTYYKLSLSGSVGDSPHMMAQDLFAGGCVDGDIAYAEAALSTQSFLRLCDLGVPFPVNRLGEYVGYQTDHDLRGRATSAGPLTSKMMTEALQKAAAKAGITVFDNFLAVKLLTVPDESGTRKIAGVLALKQDTSPDLPPEKRFALFCAPNIVFATGGPAGIYADSVYPACHTGSSGIALEAGVPGRNLTEWQYGLASTAPRWNVSGTYMQVLPRFVSVDADGTEHEFLSEYDPSPASCLSRIFLKGYEWPFDSRRARDGSSVIDLLVYRESVLRGRKVYLDYTRNPGNAADLPYSELDERARDYLTQAGACFGTPIQRLRHMNEPAYQLYLSHGVDLERNYLPIALCAQHCNGGLAVDFWWQTNISGLFAAGEAAGTHGIYRPGGSALNAGQVGSTRAAQYIAARRSDMSVDSNAFAAAASDALSFHMNLVTSVIGDSDNCEELILAAQSRMSAAAGPIRNPEGIAKALTEAQSLLENFSDTVRISDSASLVRVYKLRELLIAQIAVLTSMRDFFRNGGASRGSCIYTDPNGVSADGLEPLFRYTADDGSRKTELQEVSVGADFTAHTSTRPVHPLPDGGGFFENIWKTYRENKSVY